MTGSILIAKVERQRRYVELDGTVRAGDRLDADPETEIVILATSQVGHLVEMAHSVAVDLRKRGWAVQINPYLHRPVPPVRNGKSSISALVCAVEMTSPEPVTAEVAAPLTSATRKPRRKNRMARFQCAQCDLVRYGAGVTNHQRRTGHIGRVYVDTVVGGKPTDGSQNPRLDLSDTDPAPERVTPLVASAIPSSDLADRISSTHGYDPP